MKPQIVVGSIVELRSVDYDFYRDGLPTGQYARAKVIEFLPMRQAKVRLMNDGKTYWVGQDCMCLLEGETKLYED